MNRRFLAAFLLVLFTTAAQVRAAEPKAERKAGQTTAAPDKALRLVPEKSFLERLKAFLVLKPPTGRAGGRAPFAPECPQGDTTCYPVDGGYACSSGSCIGGTWYPNDPPRDRSPQQY